MFYFNTLNLNQISGGNQVKQGDFGSTFTYKLADEKKQELNAFDQKTAYVNLILNNNIVFSTTVIVDDSTVTFNIDKAIPTGLYFLEIKIDSYIFPSDRQTIIFVTAGAVAYDLKELVPNYDTNMTITGILSDLSKKGIDISDLKTKMASIYTNALSDHAEILTARGGQSSLDVRLDGLDAKYTDLENETTAQLAQKANQTALNVEKARIDSFTTLAVGRTTGDAELIDGRTGADGITYANIGGAVRGQFSGLKSDVDANFTFVTQLLKASARVNGKYYYRDTKVQGNSAAFAIYPPIPIVSGKTYSLKGVVGIFTTASYDGGVTATSLMQGSSTKNSDVKYTATADGLLYVTTNAGTNVMVFDADYTQPNYVEGKTNWQLKNSSVGTQITEENCTFFKHLEQHLLAVNKTKGRYYTAYSGVLRTAENADTSTFAAINLLAGETYTFINVYGYFTQIFNMSGVFIDKLTTLTGVSVTVTYTPSVNCVVYVTAYKTEVPMLVNSSTTLPQKYIEGIYANVLDIIDTSLTQAGMAADAKMVGDKFPTTLTVKKDGTGDYTTVVAAVTQANTLSDAGKTVNINIYEGDYNLLDELGGDTFLSSVVHTGTFAERQGLRLKENVNLFGVGYVILRYELPDTATYVQSQCTSALNLYQTNSIENIEFIAKNCRYALHDETNGGNPYLTRYVKNCRFTHLGNVPGLWKYPSVIGGGAGGGSDYTFIDSQFITTAYSQAWSYHTNYNQVPSHFNVDGCVGIVKASGGNSFNCTYHGTGQFGKTIFNIKNCSGNGIVRKAAETDGSEDHIEVYTNGYVTLA